MGLRCKNISPISLSLSLFLFLSLCVFPSGGPRRRSKQRRNDDCSPPLLFAFFFLFFLDCLDSRILYLFLFLLPPLFFGVCTRTYDTFLVHLLEIVGQLVLISIDLIFKLVGGVGYCRMALEHANRCLSITGYISRLTTVPCQPLAFGKGIRCKSV